MSNYEKRAKPGSHMTWLRQVAESKTTDCVLWPFKAKVNGYGAVNVQGTTKKASRVLCELVHGPAPLKHEAAHNCGVRLCCNPNHLRWASVAENAADRTKHGTQVRGERSHLSSLTAADVIAIRRARGNGAKLAEIASKYQTSPSNICDIIMRRSWAWLEGETA